MGRVAIVPTNHPHSDLFNLNIMGVVFDILMCGRVMRWFNTISGCNHMFDHYLKETTWLQEKSSQEFLAPTACHVSGNWTLVGGMTCNHNHWWTTTPLPIRNNFNIINMCNESNEGKPYCVSFWFLVFWSRKNVIAQAGDNRNGTSCWLFNAKMTVSTCLITLINS